MIPLTREEIAKWRLAHAEMLACGHRDDEAPADFKRLVDAAEAHLDEPTRLASARAEGVREGIEMAARWHEERAKACEAIGGRWDGQHTSGALVAAGEHRHHAAAIRALSPPPAEPVQTDDGWIEWGGGECPVEAGPLVGLRFRAGDEKETLLFRTYRWQRIGAPDDIIAYRIVKPAEPSAPVAPDWPTRCAALEADGIAARKRVAALEAENAALRRELEPLAREAERYDPPAGDGTENLSEAWDSRFTIGHLRRARALLQGGPDAG